MPQPTASDLHVDQLLTQVSIGYKNSSYIADQVLPIVEVLKRSDIVPQYDQSHWFRDTAQPRAPGTIASGGGWTVDVTMKYYADRFSFKKEIDDDTRDNADSQWALDVTATNFVTDKLQLRREVAFATDFFTTGVWGSDKVGTVDFNQWSDYAISTPLIDIAGYVDSVEGLVAQEANTMVMGKQVWLQLKWHPDLIDTIKYTQRGQLSVEMFQSLVELSKVLVGRSLQTTSVEGTAEASVAYSRIWGKHVLLAFVAPTPSLMTPSAGYTFVWNRVPNAIQYIKRIRAEEREVDIIEGNSYFDQKLTAKGAGVFLQNAVA